MKRATWSQRKIGGMLPVVVVLLAGCAGKPTADLTPEFRVFPPPPDTARIQYLTSITLRSQIAGEVKTTFFDHLVGEKEQSAEAMIVKPYGVTIHDGRIIVCDGVLPGLEVIDLEARSFEFFRPEGEAVLRRPVNCFTDDAGSLYVTDVERGLVVVLDDSLRFTGLIAHDSLLRPTDVFVDSSRIWITDTRAGRVRVFDRFSRQLLLSFPNVDGVAEPNAPERLVAPANLFVTSDRVYVSDLYGAKVQVFDHAGRHVKSIGSYGLGLGQFYRPKGIAVDREGVLYVVDAGFENVQMFNSAGELLMAFGGHYTRPGDMYLPAKVVIDYDNLDYFQKYVDPMFQLEYLILVTNQYGPDKLNVYGFVRLVTPAKAEPPDVF